MRVLRVFRTLCCAIGILHSTVIFTASEAQRNSNRKAKDLRKPNIIKTDSNPAVNQSPGIDEVMSTLKEIQFRKRRIDDNNIKLDTSYSNDLVGSEISLRLKTTSLHHHRTVKSIDYLVLLEEEEEDEDNGGEMKSQSLPPHETTTFIIQMAKDSSIEEIWKFNKDINDPDFLMRDAYVELSLPHHMHCWDDERAESHGYGDAAKDESAGGGRDDEEIPQNSMRFESISSATRIRHRQFHPRSRDHNVPTHQAYSSLLLLPLALTPQDVGGDDPRDTAITAAIVNYTSWTAYVNNTRFGDSDQDDGCFAGKKRNSSGLCLNKTNSSAEAEPAERNEEKESQPGGKAGVTGSTTTTPTIKNHESKPKLAIEGNKILNLGYNCVSEDRRKTSTGSESYGDDDDGGGGQVLVINALPLIRMWLGERKFCPDTSRDLGTLVFALMIDGSVAKSEEEGEQVATADQQELDDDDEEDEMAKEKVGQTAATSTEGRDGGVGEMQHHHHHHHHHRLLLGGDVEAIIRLKYVMDRKAFVILEIFCPSDALWTGEIEIFLN